MAEEKSIFSHTSQISEEPSDPEISSSIKRKDKLNRGIQWYYAPVFLLAWLAIFFAIVYPIFFYLPEGIRIENENENKCRFIAQRAENILYDIEAIGERTVGTFANENRTVELLLKEIGKIRDAMNEDLYEMELDIQQVSGAYLHWAMINTYQGVQNVVVKLSPKNSKSESYLLINSHFDSKPGSPGAGDDGGMVVIMLEVLRVLATSDCGHFTNPIVFLFNGAEENPLQTSHGFITQHKWAKNCKALINLDCAGSGHREILFQAGPNHPWLMKYYGKYVNRPFATTMAEEVFETGLVPSDTDFRIFKNFGNLPGLDMVHSHNGYVYHTKFDKSDVIPIGTLQITGEHILELAQGLASAPELEDPSKHATGHTIFFDYLGLFFVYYTETEGKVINTIISLAAIIVPAMSLWLMAKQDQLDIKDVLRSFGIVFGFHFLGFLLAFGFPLLIAVFYDWDDRTMTWFTHRWLVIGQYVCPCLFGLSMPTLSYMTFQKSENKVSKPYRVQMALHSQSIILAVLCIIVTYIGVRSSYLFMISLFFYVCSLLINLVFSLQRRGYMWMIPLLVSQIMPFMYFTYLIHAFLCIVTPMMARFGSDSNPDIYIAGLCVLGTILSMGFVIPTLSIFRRPRFVLVSLLVVTFIFTMISVSSVGFPYRAKTNVGRVNFLHVRRVFYNFDGSVEKNDSGFYFDFQDRRMHKPIADAVDLTGLRSTGDDCEELMMCGVPLFNHRWHKARKTGMWLPSNTPIEIPSDPELKFIGKTYHPENSTTRYQFLLTGPPHMGIFLQPLEGAELVDWSFLREALDKWQPPYHVFFSYGKDDSPLPFHFDFKKSDGRFDVPLFELGIAAHYLNYQLPRGQAAEEFLSKFPDYVHCMEWPSSYERYIF